MTMAETRRHCEQLRDRIDELRGPSDVPHLQQAVHQAGGGRTSNLNLKQRRLLKGHFGKIYAMHWSSKDSVHLVSASQDGKLIIWNAITTNKVEAVPLRSSWVMTCAYSPSGKMVACGGLDNICSIFRLHSANQTPSSGAAAPDASPSPDASRKNEPVAELQYHEGYLSCCRFLDDREILTSSGDSTSILWDVDTRNPKMVFDAHVGDVMSVSTDATGNMFVSGSCDATARVFDLRNAKAVASFTGHESDVNSVHMFPDNQSFCSGSDDSCCRFFDLRSMRQLQQYQDENILCGITSVAPSKTGQYLFAGYDDYACIGWDTLTGQQAQTMQCHENRVSCIGVNDTGKALCTGSWDTLLMVFA